MQSTVLRAHFETVLGRRIAAPFTDLDKRVCETVSSGIHPFDLQTGGLPRGAITEISGQPSSGKTSMLLSILASATNREEFCVLVDGTDTFCPESGADAGIHLQRLLWVRCNNLDQTLKVTDLLLQGGGFGVVALDLSDLPGENVSLATWFRFQRSIENTSTILVILSPEGVAKTCASLAIHMESHVSAPELGPTFTTLFETRDVTAQILRNRQSPSGSRNSRVCFRLHSSFSRPGARP